MENNLNRLLLAIIADKVYKLTFEKIMATQEETKQAVEDCLKRIGRASRAIFEEFSVETYTQGGYSSGTWVYKFSPPRVSIEYWFSSFSSKKEETDITYMDDNDLAKLENDLRACFSKVQEAVKRKKGMF